jgi:hypothetical protein
MGLMNYRLPGLFGLDEMDPRALAEYEAMRNVPPARPDPSPLARIWGTEGGLFIGGRGDPKGYTPPGPPYSPPLKLGRYPMPSLLPSYPPTNVMPPQPPPPAPPQRPDNMTAVDFPPEQQMPPVEVQDMPADPRYGIQQGADQGFGSYQASAADFGEKQSPQARQGGLFGGGPQNINLALLQAGLGTMAAGGWQKMPVTLGQAIGQGSYPSVQTQIEQNKWDEQRGMREEELNIRRMTGEAYRDQLKAQAEDRKQAGIRAQRMEALNTELQAALAAGDSEKAKHIARSMAFYDNPESAYKTYVEEGKGPKLELKKLPKKGPDGKPMIDPRTGDQVMEAWWVDPQGNKIRPEGDVIGSGGVRVSVGAPQMFDPTQSAFDVETKLRGELEPLVKNSKAGMDLSRQFDSAIALDTPSGYKAAATMAQKLIEPTNQALINEISRLEGGGDLVERIRGSLSQFITGTPSQQQIDDMKKFAKAMETAYRNQAIKARKQYKDLGTKYQGGNQYIRPDRIVLPDDELDAWEALSE